MIILYNFIYSNSGLLAINMYVNIWNVTHVSLELNMQHRTNYKNISVYSYCEFATPRITYISHEILIKFQKH